MKTDCKHKGFWFSIKLLWIRRKYLWCVKCRDAIPVKKVFENADILQRGLDGYFKSSLKEQ